MFYINTEECVQFARWLVFRVYAWRRMVKRFTSLRSEALKGLLPQKSHLIINNEIQKAEHASWAEGTARTISKLGRRNP